MNIFNILNDDNPLTKILDSSVGWYRYGRNVTGSAASVFDKKGVKSILGGNYVGHNGYAEYKGNPSIARRILDGIVNGIKDLVRNAIENITSIFGFTNTNTFSSDMSQNDGKIESVFKSYVLDTRGNSNGSDTTVILDSGMVEGAMGNAQNKDLKLGNVNLANNPNTDNTNEKRDGYRFIDKDGHSLVYSVYNDDDLSFNDTNISIIKSNNDNYVYSNYTLKDEEVLYDIDFTKFWHITEEEKKEISVVKAK